jgi:hypothetical protein
VNTVVKTSAEPVEQSQKTPVITTESPTRIASVPGGTAGTEPTAPDVIFNPDAIPEILRIHDQWAVFRLAWDPEKNKYKKGPNRGFKSNTPSTWVSFDRAWARPGLYAAPAFALDAAPPADTDRLIVIDIDHCFHDGRLDPRAAFLVSLFPGTYIERSVSRTGLHIFVRGRTPLNGQERLPLTGGDLDIEVYSSRRFIVMTGDILDSAATRILHLQPSLDILKLLAAPQPDGTPGRDCGSVAGADSAAPTPPATPASRTDAERLRDALSRLDSSAYPDWFRYGIAIKRWGLDTDMIDDAYTIFDTWSSGTTRGNYDEDSNRRLWDSWDCTGVQNPVTVGTIFHDARADGWTPPPLLLPVVAVSTPEGSADVPPADVTVLRSALWELSQRDVSAAEHHRAAGDAVSDWLSARGRFFHHADLRDFPSCMYFDSEKKYLHRVQSDEFLSWLSDSMRVNRTEPIFRFAASAVENAALTGPHATPIIPAEYWQATSAGVYLSCGPGRMCRITAHDISMVDNGTDGVVFSAGAVLSPWTLTSPADPFDACRLFRDAAYVSDHGLMLLKLWACTMLTHQRTKPPLCISGTVGSGKTRLAVGLFELLGFPPRVSAITKNGESDFWAQVACGGLVTFDNADTRNDWLADSLAAAATDGGHEKRRLYTDAERVYLRARSWVIITSANPTFAADGGLADRLLVVRLDRLKKETAESSLSDEIAAARNAGLSWMAVMIHRALADTSGVPSAINRRHPDHAQMAFRIGRAMGLEREAIAALQAAEADKSSFNLENDPLGSVLLELTEQSAVGLHGTASELAQEIINFDPYWDGKLSSKSFGRRVTKLWPHLEQSLQATMTQDSRDRTKTYSFNVMRTVS